MNFQEFKKLTGLNMSLEEAKAHNPLYNKTEEELLEAVKENGYAIRYIDTSKFGNTTKIAGIDFSQEDLIALKKLLEIS